MRSACHAGGAFHALTFLNHRCSDVLRSGLALSSFGFFFIAVMGTASGDAGQPVSAAIIGMGVAGGFSLLVLASVAACVAIGVLKLSEWARIVSTASVAAGIIAVIATTGINL